VRHVTCSALVKQQQQHGFWLLVLVYYSETLCVICCFASFDQSKIEQLFTKYFLHTMGLAGERTGWAVRGALILLVVTLTRSSSEDNSNSNVGTSTRGQSTQTGAHGSPDIKISKTPATSVTSKSRLSVPTKPTDIDNVTTLMPICANATLNMDQNSTDCNGTKPTNTAGGGSLIVGMVGGDYQSYVRAFYVVVAVTGIALVYLGVKFYM